MNAAELADVARGLLYSSTGRDALAQDALPLGAALGSLDHDEAATFARAVDDWLAYRQPVAT